MNNFSFIFIAALAGSLLLRYWLAARHLAHVRAHRAAVPASFAERISLADHQKAADYTLTNTRFGMLALAWDSLLLLGWTLGGGLELLDGIWRDTGLGPIPGGTGLLLSAMVIMTLLDMPFTLYHTFVIEQRFGFNRSTAGVFIADLLKQAILLLVIGGSVAGAGPVDHGILGRALVAVCLAGLDGLHPGDVLGLSRDYRTPVQQVHAAG